jgi:hypothetical protein
MAMTQTTPNVTWRLMFFRPDDTMALSLPITEDQARMIWPCVIEEGWTEELNPVGDWPLTVHLGASVG